MVMPTPAFERLPLAHPHAEVLWCPQWLPSAEADALFHTLLQETPWEQVSYRFHGQDVPMPRQVAWYSEPAQSYGYSGIQHEGRPFTPTLTDLRLRLSEEAKVAFNSVLLNRYRTGQDSVAWHADDEEELGPAPVIASLSLGATRRFGFKAKEGADRLSLDLTHGSLLLMRRQTQRHYLHCIGKTAKPVSERVNLTFRRVFATAP